MRLSRDKGRNILARLTSFVKDCVVDLVEGYVSTEDLIKIYICVIIFSIFFMAGVAS